MSGQIASVLVDPGELRRQAEQILIAYGADPPEAAVQADARLQGELRGRPGQGQGMRGIALDREVYESLRELARARGVGVVRQTGASSQVSGEHSYTWIMATKASKHQQSMTLDEYLAFEESSAVKHEFVGGEVFAFAGTTVRHNRIAGNIYASILTALGNRTDCTVMFGDVKLQAAPDVVYYPDVMVVRDPEDDHPLIKSRPCLVVEVLSEGTRTNDLREKLFLYRQILSLESYLIVEQDEAKVYRHWRDDERLWWQDVIPQHGSVPIPCPEFKLALDDIYRNLPEIPPAS